MKILLVEDYDSIREMLEICITDYVPNVTLLSASHMSNARWLRVNNPDLALAILDGSIDEHLDGLELIEELRIWNYTGPILSISGDPDSVQKMLEAGATHALPKPFEIDMFLKKISEILHLEIKR